MAKLHGKHTRIFIDGYDISGDFNSFEPSNASDTAEVSGFGDDIKKYVAGLPDSSMRLAGLFNDSANAGHAIMTARLNNDVMFTGIWGNTSGRFGASGSALMSEYSASSPIGGAVAINAQFSGAGSSAGTFHFVQTILDKSGLVTAGVSGTVDTGTVSSPGAAGHLQFFSGTGTIALQDASSTAGPFTTRINFGLRTAPYAAYIGTYNGTPDRYWRAIMLNGTGTAWAGLRRL